MRRSMLSSVIGIVLILVMTAMCASPGARLATTTSTATTTTVHVSLRFTGIVHLVGTAPDERLVVARNLTKETMKHFPVIIASDSFPSNLPKTGTVGGRDYHWNDLPVGITIVPALDTALGHNVTLSLSEDGDPRTTCPKGSTTTVAPDSLHWLPRLSNVSPVTGTPAVDPKYTTATPAGSDVVFRLPIKNGKLLADELSTQIFAFSDGQASYGEQTVANFLRYHFDVELKRTSTSDPFEFDLVAQDFSGATTTLGTFEPSGDEIEIIIANLPDKAFFNPMLYKPLMHFKDLSYSITTGITPMTPILLTQTCGGPVGSEVECGPVRVP